MPDPAPESGPAPRPGRAARLPDLVALRWAALLAAEAAGAPSPGSIARVRLRRALDAHAAEILPILLGNGATDEDGIFHGRLALCLPDVLHWAELAYDLRGGHWSLGLPSGRGLLDLLREAWGTEDALSEDEAVQRALVRLGAAALETLAGAGRLAPVPPGPGRRGRR